MVATVNVALDYPMVKYLLRCWNRNRLLPRTISLRTARPKLIARQGGLCALCNATLENHGKQTHRDHIRSVEDFAADVLAGRLTFEEAYVQLNDETNVRAVCSACNYARRRNGGRR